MLEDLVTLAWGTIARSEAGLNGERRALSLSVIESLAESQGATEHRTDEQTNSSGWKFQASLL